MSIIYLFIFFSFLKIGSGEVNVIIYKDKYVLKVEPYGISVNIPINIALQINPLNIAILEGFYIKGYLGKRIYSFHKDLDSIKDECNKKI